MYKANADIRKACKENRISLWRVAERYNGGMADSNFSRLLRHELSEAQKQKVLNIIEMLKVEEVSA
ncbi:hypothetical protein SAMN02745823_03258 [Sporobacter termitidis DSM 10068]|uniref:Uncharacterized protein n=1 Tax=Sporobacter termitidis DSM 10068 TaxID=1123282 RepID=A0A1M5Z654_9FIRM|nr:hypothetical protein [Sporobacter termitidis]SHI19671.1 hypothetical protein SAMN02745823_03258 [Sporobacter termitidis DSM 10068]